MRTEVRQQTDRAPTVRVPCGDHWIYLDRAWAQRLGVKRTAGVYRIRGRELRRRLSDELLRVHTSGQVSTLLKPGAPQPQAWILPEDVRRTA